MKKILLGLLTLFLSVTALFLILNFIFNESRVLKINWEINVPRPTKVNVVYDVGFQDGYIFKIWKYNLKKSKKIMKSEKFKKIDIEVVQNILIKYHSYLPDKEKEKYNQKTQRVNLLNSNNFYAYVEAEKGFVLLILLTDTNELYYFESF